MAREPIISNSNPSDDDENQPQLRPQRLSEMVGQREVIEVLRIAIDAALKRGEALGHLLFDGPPGLGKTTFAHCIANEMDVSRQLANGAGLKAPKDLIPYLTNADYRSVLFIDEIHRLPRAVEEYLYTAMEDFRIDIVLGEGVNARTLNVDLKPFTLIGATTRAGMLSAPLRDRFQIRKHLDFYTVEDLTDIVLRNARRLNQPIEPDAAAEIARRSRATPRIAINGLLWVRDYAQAKANGRVTREVTVAALEMNGIDHLGLTPLDRRYMETIVRVFGGGPVGLEAVAHTMNTSSDTIADEVEPFLLRSELVVRTPRGRVVTSKGFEHLKLLPPNSGSSQRDLF